MKKSIFKEFKQDEIAKLSNIVGGEEVIEQTNDGADEYRGSTTCHDDLGGVDETGDSSDFYDCNTNTAVFSPANPVGVSIMMNGDTFMSDFFNQFTVAI